MYIHLLVILDLSYSYDMPIRILDIWMFIKQLSVK